MMFQAVLIYYVAIFSSLLFSWHRVVDLTDRTSWQISNDASHLCNAKLIGGSSVHYMPHLPFPSPTEVRDKGDDELKDPTDPEIVKFVGNLSRNSKGLLHSEKRLLAELKISLENRSLVSLLVLYQCWKVLDS